jgi:hypothetical protein
MTQTAGTSSPPATQVSVKARAGRLARSRLVSGARALHFELSYEVKSSRDREKHCKKPALIAFTERLAPGLLPPLSGAEFAAGRAFRSPWAKLLGARRLHDELGFSEAVRCD